MGFLYAICVILSGICGITAILDMGMNGGRYAEWTPWGLVLCVLLAIASRIFLELAK